MQTPILLLLFNRPEITRKLLSRLELIKPSTIYVNIDGPRNALDEKKINKVKELIANISWECKVFKKYNLNNLGCRNSVIAAIDWLFENEEYGIILEDDCLPHINFFDYVEHNLLKYKDTLNIYQIGGYNPIEKATRNKFETPFFTNLSLCWGWATWKRAWNKFDRNMNDLETFSKSKIFKSTLPNYLSRVYLIDKFRKTKARKNDSWAYFWTYTILKNNGLCLTPNYNLIENIGFGLDATHTIKGQSQTVAKVLPKILDSNYENTQEGVNQKIFYRSQKSKSKLLLWCIRLRLNTFIGIKK